MIKGKLHFASGALLIALGPIIFCSCHKKLVNPTTTSNEISLANFPNKAGDQWVYFVQDSVANINDTLTVTVTAADSFLIWPCLIWQYVYSNGATDTLQAVTLGDTINYYENVHYPFATVSFRFPFSADSTWRDNYGGSYQSLSIGNYSYLNHSFPDVYAINHTVKWAFGGNETDNIYVEPGIGIVHRRILQYNEPDMTYQTWTLISYHLN